MSRPLWGLPTLRLPKPAWPLTGPGTRGQTGDAPEARPVNRGRRLTGRRTACLHPGRSGSSQCPPLPTPARGGRLTDMQNPSSLPTLPPSSCVSTATQGRLATRTEDLSPCPPPGALHSLSAAQWPPPSCGDGHGPVGLQGARASPSRSSSWSRSTCAPGCHRRHRSCVYLQPPPREELSVRSGGGGEGQGQSPPATSLGPTWLYRMGLML